MPPLLFLHGLESGPIGTKSAHLRTVFGDVLCPDTTGLLDPEARLERVLTLTADVRDAIVIGSSFGGLMAVLLAHRRPERCRALVLLAPALRPDLVEDLQPQPPTWILHGRDDPIVPCAWSEGWAERTGARLTRVDDGHSLRHSLDAIIQLVRQAQEPPDRSA
jgi:pimeloyl-ACP methyl ester carboxylesterase